VTVNVPVEVRVNGVDAAAVKGVAVAGVIDRVNVPTATVTAVVAPAGIAVGVGVAVPLAVPTKPAANVTLRTPAVVTGKLCRPVVNGAAVGVTPVITAAVLVIVNVPVEVNVTRVVTPAGNAVGVAPVVPLTVPVIPAGIVIFTVGVAPAVVTV
jgi:hypothetical protein